MKRLPVISLTSSSLAFILLIIKSSIGSLGFGMVDALYFFLISVQLILVILLFLFYRKKNRKFINFSHIACILLSFYYYYILANSGPEGGTW